MSSGPPSQSFTQPSLVDWFKTHIEALHAPQQTGTHTPLMDLFDSTFSPSATFFINSEPASRERVLEDIIALHGTTEIEDDNQKDSSREASGITPTNPTQVKLAKLPVLQRPGTSTILEWVSVDVAPKRLDGEEEAHANERAGGEGYFVKAEPETGTLYASLTLTRTLPFRVRAGPMQRRRVVSVVARVEHVPDTTVDRSGNGRSADGRRIVRYEETSEEGPVPVKLAPANLLV